MHKKFLITSTLALGSALCLITTLQDECLALTVVNEANPKLDFQVSGAVRFMTEKGEKSGMGADIGDKNKRYSIAQGKKRVLGETNKMALSASLSEAVHRINSLKGKITSYELSVDTWNHPSGYGPDWKRKFQSKDDLLKYWDHTIVFKADGKVEVE